MVMRNRTYSELQQLDTLEERFRYLSLRGEVGAATFGYDRWMNQSFYHSREWRRVRSHVISRDNGCDLGISGFELHTNLHIHHMNPMRPEDIEHSVAVILDPEFLITVSQRTHNAIHYGDESQLPRELVERRPGDHILWR